MENFDKSSETEMNRMIAEIHESVRTLPDRLKRIEDSVAAKKPLVLQLQASQTANGFELQDSSGGVLASLDAGGKLVARNFKSGTGSPEGSVVGVIGDLYTRTDGGAGTTLYCKESGTGDTGWVAK